MTGSVSQFIHFSSSPSCVHASILYSSTENWCSLKPPCLCKPQKPLHPATITLAPVACFVHIRSSGVQGSTSMVLLNLSMIPSNFDQISLGSDNGKLVIENDLKTSGAPNYKLHGHNWESDNPTQQTHLKGPRCWERLKGGEGDDRGWDGWMASLTQWTWVWMDSWSWWWTGRPGVLRFMGSQRVGHDWATELNWTQQTAESVFV